MKTITSTLIGMMIAVPFVFAAGYIPKASAVQDQASQGQISTAQVSVADFAKYAYAFDQGVKASAVSMNTSDGATSCSEVSVTNVPASSGAVAGASTVSMPMGVGRGVSNDNRATKPQSKPNSTTPLRSNELVTSMINSYNTYSTMVHNSSTVLNTNSNNAVGSNNTTSTSMKLEVEDSKNVMVGVSNDPSATMITNTDSFNKDSYNTKTDTSVINESFNKETNLAINSGNTETKTENKTEDSYNTENKIEESYNTENETEDSNNSLTMSNESNTTNNTEVNKTINSNNETDIELEDIEIGAPHKDHFQAV